MDREKYIDKKLKQALHDDVIVPDVVNNKCKEAYDIIRTINKNSILDSNDIENEIDNIDKHFDEKDELKNYKATKNRSKRILKKSMIAASISLIIIGALAFTNSDVVAYMEKIGDKIEYFFNYKMDLSDYKTSVNKSATYKNITVNVNEIMMDGEELLINLDIDDSKLDKEKYGITDNSLLLNTPHITIGDMNFVNTGLSSETVYHDNGTSSTLITCSLKNLDTDGDGKAEEKNFEILENVDLDKDYNIKISFNTIECMINKNMEDNEVVKVSGDIVESEDGDYVEGFGYISGKWNIKGSINFGKSAEKIKVYKVKEEINIDTEGLVGKINIDEVKITPAKTRIKASLEISENNIDTKSVDDRWLELLLKNKDGEFINGDQAAWYVEKSDEKVEIVAEFAETDIDKLVIVPQLLTFLQTGATSTDTFEDNSIEINLLDYKVE